jgi:hypothetical protein
MVVKNVAEGWLTDPEIWTPWTCVPMPIERKCRRILHEADPRDLPAKTSFCHSGREEENHIYLHNPSMYVSSYYFFYSLCRSLLSTVITQSRKYCSQKRLFRYIFQGLSLITGSQHAKFSDNMGSPSQNSTSSSATVRCYQLSPALSKHMY